jgi:uncharacterized membrane protein (UPF0127 family)
MTGVRDGPTTSVICYTDGGEARYFLEVAANLAERARGLMHRPSMLSDWGMIFIYPAEEPLSFWMQNTYISLDMLFLNHEALVVGVVAEAEPLTRDSRSVPGSSQYVIELNAGEAARQGIAANTRCELLNLP